MKLNELAGIIEEFSPLDLQESWDNCGFQVRLGNPEISRILVAMEINGSVIDEAIEKQVQVIVTHHPMLFSPIKHVDDSNFIENYIVRLIQAGISVYSSHTSLDRCIGGNNDYLAKLLHLRDVELMKEDSSGFCRVGYVDGDCTVLEYIRQISSWLNLPQNYFQFAGELTDRVNKVGICTGAGGDFLTNAWDAGCDLFITGDVKYHLAQSARELGINLLDLGHFGSEYIFTENMSNILCQRIPSRDEIEIIESKIDLNPFVII